MRGACFAALVALVLALVAWPVSAEPRNVDEAGYLDPKLPVGVLVAVLGGAGMVGGAAWYALDEQVHCAKDPACEDRIPRVGGALGMMSGGAAMAIAGITIAEAAARAPAPRREQSDVAIGVGVTFTGICIGGLVAAYTMYLHSSASPQPGHPAELVAPLPGIAACGLGVPVWLKGMRPSHGALEARRTKTPSAERADWGPRSTAALAVGGGMVALGTVGTVTALVWGHTEGRYQPGPEGDDGYLSGVVGSVYLALPALAMLGSGIPLVARGGASAPPAWRISRVPRLDISPAGLTLTTRF